MLQTLTATALAVLYLTNGVLMLVDPLAWYAQVPGVSASGPMNPHFIRDIGFIHVLSGGCFVLAVRKPHQLRLWAGIGSAWPALHGIFHLAEWAHHGLPAGLILTAEIVAVIAPVMVGILLVATAKAQSSNTFGRS